MLNDNLTKQTLKTTVRQNRTTEGWPSKIVHGHFPRRIKGHIHTTLTFGPKQVKDAKEG